MRGVILSVHTTLADSKVCDSGVVTLRYRLA
jgi:hypothetical protein